MDGLVPLLNLVLFSASFMSLRTLSRIGCPVACNRDDRHTHKQTHKHQQPQVRSVWSIESPASLADKQETTALLLLHTPRFSMKTAFEFQSPLWGILGYGQGTGRIAELEVAGGNVV